MGKRRESLKQPTPLTDTFLKPLAVMSNGMVGCVVWADSHEYTGHSTAHTLQLLLTTC